MQPLESLPARTYLVSFDRDRDKLTGRTWLGYAIRAAALADLWASGRLVDDHGRARIPAGAPTSGKPPADPILRDVWNEVADSPDRWTALVRRNRSRTANAVSAQLEASGLIHIERRASRWRAARVELRDPLAVTRLDERIGTILRDSRPFDRLPLADAAWVGILAVAGIRTAMTKERTREYAIRIAAAIAAGGPAVDGLKHALRQAQSSAA